MKKKIIIAVISALLAITALLCIVPSLAKYITTQGMQTEVDSDNFYFASDYLKSDSIPVYTVIGDRVTFEVRNYADSLRINRSNIIYSVTSDGGAVNKSVGTLTGGSSDCDSITLTYTFSDGEDQREITVTVESDEPYAKELKAKFILQKTGLTYEIKDSAGSYYAELYIYTGNIGQSVTLEWNKEKLLIDETNDYIFGNLNSEKNSATTENIGARTTVKIVFFKKNINENYTCGITQASGGTITLPTASIS
jgi:hypothetical protein